MAIPPVMASAATSLTHKMLANVVDKLRGGRRLRRRTAGGEPHGKRDEERGAS
jgi:hypothetical protein